MNGIRDDFSERIGILWNTRRLPPALSERARTMARVGFRRNQMRRDVVPRISRID
jgi:hypothetical protein